jgi:hypothetical protein
MFSIYHFWRDLVSKKQYFLTVEKLENFPYSSSLFSCKSKGKFPDLAIKVNSYKRLFIGGELIELKDSKSYSISSFNSTIPTGKKEIQEIVKGKRNKIKEQMETRGDDINSLPIRDLFYLVRGKNQDQVKVCLIHGSFFETIKVNELIKQAFSQVLEERLKETGESISDNLKSKILAIFSEQDSFSKVRDITKASVTIRFKITAELKKEGNILNTQKYPQILDNTLNFLIPCDSEQEETNILNKMQLVYSQTELNNFTIFKLKHDFNGEFLVFQTSLV